MKQVKHKWISKRLILARLVVVALLVVASGFVAITAFEQHQSVLGVKSYLINNRVEIEREYQESRPFALTSMHAAGLRSYQWRFENSVTIPSRKIYVRYLISVSLLMAAGALMFFWRRRSK